MKVAHISQTDGEGGAGRAAWRIHRSLLALGVDSSMIVGNKCTADATVFSARRPLSPLSEYLEAKLSHYKAAPGAGHFSLGRFGWFHPAADARVRAADIVCLYWINGGYITPESLAGLKQPVVWRLSDVWPFTGGCHYPGDCERHAKGCGHCPQLASPAANDDSACLIERKHNAWRDLNLTVAAPSRWIAGLAAKSALFSGRRIAVIPTGVDTTIYRPLDRAAARARFNIPPDKTVILFGAPDPADPRKGFAQLAKALGVLAQSLEKEKLLLAVLGHRRIEAPLPVMHLGRIDDDEALAAAYNAADVAVVPSLEDNLPNAALEAIACGTPVAGFNVCGMGEIVSHQHNGYLASFCDSSELASGIGWLLADPARLAQQRQNARVHTLAHFDLTSQAKAYLGLYQELAASHAYA